jgi:hypothetical protein
LRKLKIAAFPQLQALGRQQPAFMGGNYAAKSVPHILQFPLAKQTLQSG